jgi:acetylornithine deacetylase/succinyl-diaminopimelate desuccinylase-like protein
MKIKTYIDTEKQRFLDELFEFLRIPSVSADDAYKSDVAQAAEWVAESLRKIGLDIVEVHTTAGHPIVYAEHIIDHTKPTVLVYGHYDVQPADPIELWDSGPFEPVLKDQKIYARGACDDKGQIYMHIKALEAMLATQTLPCNVKIMFEGEEEVGSENLGYFIVANKEKLSSDVILISDTSIIANDTPSIEAGLRGLTYMEVDVTGPNRDLHSGVFGGAVSNPANVLAKMIASLHDEYGKITIPGFYADVVELTASERAELALAPFDIDEYKKDLGIAAVNGEAAYTTIERAAIRPTLDVNGIWAGYTGEGSKTVLPSKASAKISMRLVPNQDWETIATLFTSHMASIAPPSVQVKVTKHHGGQPYVTPRSHPGYKAAFKAMHAAWGIAPVMTRGGGSIPIVALFEKVLGQKSILMGFGLDSDAIHSPNEHYGLFNFYKGIETIPLFYKYFAEEKA